jgi:hypothetical protein
MADDKESVLEKSFYMILIALLPLLCGYFWRKSIISSKKVFLKEDLNFKLIEILNNTQKGENISDLSIKLNVPVASVKIVLEGLIKSGIVTTYLNRAGVSKYKIQKSADN